MSSLKYEVHDCWFSCRGKRKSSINACHIVEHSTLLADGLACYRCLRWASHKACMHSVKPTLRTERSWACLKNVRKIQSGQRGYIQLSMTRNERLNVLLFTQDWKLVNTTKIGQVLVKAAKNFGTLARIYRTSGCSKNSCHPSRNVSSFVFDASICSPCSTLYCASGKDGEKGMHASTWSRSTPLQTHPSPCLFAHGMGFLISVNYS